MAHLESPRPSRQELVRAVRAELSDFIGALSDAEGNMFSLGGREALERMRRISQLLALLEAGE